MSMEDMKFSQMTTFGNHLYRHKGEIAEIRMENTRTGVKKTIVDDSGMIVAFPGVAHPELVSLYKHGILSGQIRFRSDISRLGDQYALIWQIQPDGRYWEDDDGFGGSSDDEIDLYARLDEDGNFTEAFHIYSIGRNILYGTDAEERLNEALRGKAEPLTSIREHVPEMLDEMKKLIKIPQKGSACYSIPGTSYQAALSLQKEGDKWFVRASMKRQFSDTSMIGWLEFLPLEEQRTYLNSAQALADAEEELTTLLRQIRREDQEGTR